METSTQPKIFLSYAWANTDVADEIDNTFKQFGITFQRDIRDVKYADSIKGFMHLVGKADFVIMLISDAYIKSENCMYEVVEVLNTHEYEKKVLPIIVDDTQLFKRDNQKIYYQYWEEELKKSSALLLDFINEKTLEDKKKIHNINNNLGIFFQKLTDLKSETFENLKADNYKLILQKINVEAERVLEEILKAIEILDEEDRGIALEEIDKKYPDNGYVLFYKAYNADRNRLFKLARKLYENFTSKYASAEAFNNLACILEEHFNDYEQAQKNYKLALKLSPYSATYCYNYGRFLDIRLGELEEALELYNRAITADAKHVQAIVNRGSILELLKKDILGAIKDYKMALEIDSRNKTANFNYARCLVQYLGFPGEAKKYYEIAIDIDPSFAKAYMGLGTIYEYDLYDYDKARELYENAVKLDPHLEQANRFLTNLIRNYFSHR